MYATPLNARDIVQRVQEVLDYCPESGEFVWIKPPDNHTRLLNTVAGGNGSGYTMIKIDGQKYKAHRLAWLVMTGEWPDGFVDHKDGNQLNNAFSNLRICDQTDNNANRKRNKGKDLPKGVRYVKGRFQARIMCKGKMKSLGCFDSIESAAHAYAAAANEEFKEFARPA